MMDYPLAEKIGHPNLLVGRGREFENFGTWLDNIPDHISKSRVILSRRKSGKTAFVQRIFNQLWSANGEVIPFYFEVLDKKVWYPDFAENYFATFASHYISFLERDPVLVMQPWNLEQIHEYSISTSHRMLQEGIKQLRYYKNNHSYDLMWHFACAAPHRYAAILNTQFLVILDEFQYIATTVYRDEACERYLDETMPGSYHALSESKIAPMLVTGSYISWLMKISARFLEAGRLTQWYMPPYLTPDEGLQAVYAYANIYKTPVTNDTAIQINQTCMSDPFFISCVMQSTCPNRDLTTAEGVVQTVAYELLDRRSEMFNTWGEYIHKTLDTINDRNAKAMLLFLSQNNHRHWNTREIKEKLNLDMDVQTIQKKLLLLVEADILEWGPSDISFRGLQDGTLNLILRHRFEEEINNFVPDVKQDMREDIAAVTRDRNRLRGMLNQVMGWVAEQQLATEFRSRKRFRLSAFFAGVHDDTELNIGNVRLRVPVQREDGKNMELDVVGESACGRIVIVEVKKRQQKMGAKAIEDFLEKAQVYAQTMPTNPILMAFLSLGGFTEEALQICITHGIGYAETIAWE